MKNMSKMCLQFIITPCLVLFATLTFADNSSNSIESFATQLKQNTANAKKYYLQLYQNKYNQIIQDSSLKEAIPTLKQNLPAPSSTQQGTPIPSQPSINNNVFNANPAPQQNIFQ